MICTRKVSESVNASLSTSLIILNEHSNSKVLCKPGYWLTGLARWIVKVCKLPYYSFSSPSGSTTPLLREWLFICCCGSVRPYIWEIFEINFTGPSDRWACPISVSGHSYHFSLWICQCTYLHMVFIENNRYGIASPCLSFVLFLAARRRLLLII